MPADRSTCSDDEVAIQLDVTIDCAFDKKIGIAGNAAGDPGMGSDGSRHGLVHVHVNMAFKSGAVCDQNARRFDVTDHSPIAGDMDAFGS